MMVLPHLSELCTAQARTRSDKFPAVPGIIRSKYVPVAKVTVKKVFKKKCLRLDVSENSHCSPVNFRQSVAVLGAEIRTDTQVRGARR